MAAIELKHSAFIHIPKCGGRSISNTLKSCVAGARYIGDSVYDAHERPDIGDKMGLFFVRHPITMLNSLWEHRSRRHGNSRDKEWNWQQNVELERACGCKTLEGFFMCISKNPGIITRYYEHWMTPYFPKIVIGRVEHMQNDLISMLNCVGETFDVQKVKGTVRSVIGRGSNKIELRKLVDTRFDLIEQIMMNEECLRNEFGYTANEIRTLN